jgi:peptidoglycan/LPS O-acetylase OafA/YrhL
MGFLRLWLAIAVYLQHLGAHGWSPAYYPINGKIAVNSFFIISGFLMQFVIRRNYGGALAFWKSRFLRIYPVYWLVLAASVLFVVLNQYHQEPRYYRTDLSLDNPAPYPKWHFQLIADDPNLEDKLAYAGVQLGIFGDYLSFQFAYDPALHHFTRFQKADDVFLWGGNFWLLPQAWSLDVELCFYLLVPFLLTRPWFIVLLAYVMTFRADHYFSGFPIYPDLPFIPLLPFFLAGALGCRFYLAFLRNSPRSYMRLSLLLLSAIVLYSVAFRRLHMPDTANEYCFYVMTAIALPFLFKSTKDNAFDRFLGDFSYPIYLWHLLIKGLAMAFFAKYGYLAWDMQPVLTLLFAGLTIFCIERPLDRYRHKKFRQQVSSEAASATHPDARSTCPAGTYEPVSL